MFVKFTKQQAGKVKKQWYEKKGWKSLFDASNYSDIKEVQISQIFRYQIFRYQRLNTQINTLKPFNIEPCNVIPKKYVGLEEEGNRKEEIKLSPQNSIANIDWCKCGYECKSVSKFAESFWTLRRLNFRGAREVSCHAAHLPST